MSDPDRPIHDPLVGTRSIEPGGGRDGRGSEPGPWGPDPAPGPWATAVAGALFMATGISLVAHVLLGVPLPLVLATVVVLLGVVAALLQRDEPGGWWQRHRRAIVVGALAGVASTAVYDLSRFALVIVGGLPSSPYAALPFFGRALVGDGAPTTVVQWAGTGFHFANGIVFAIAYTIWFGRRPWWWGILFGLGLEAAMLAIYPGWLDIRAIGEFTRLSLLGHVCYGATLGALVARRRP